VRSPPSVAARGLVLREGGKEEPEYFSGAKRPKNTQVRRYPFFNDFTKMGYTKLSK
jgi:hypothetical protein